MTIVDAGPLLAILDRDDQDHDVCVDALARLRPPLLTTWPAFTEAMYLAGARAGWDAQENLWPLVLRNDLRVLPVQDSDLKRAHDLMKKYRDLPMDLADASLVVLAEALNESRVFTLDADFRTYRLHG